MAAEPGGSEYDPLFARASAEPTSPEAEQAFAAFAAASRVYLSSPVPWLSWALLLPAAAFATRALGPAAVPGALLFLWSGTILVGGAVEGAALYRARRRFTPSPLGAWAMRVQGNLSLVAVALSVALVASGAASSLPGLWLLLLGHSFFVLGGLAFRPLRTAGVIYQVGGGMSLLPWLDPMTSFAATTFVANLWVAIQLLRRARAEAPRR